MIGSMLGMIVIDFGQIRLIYSKANEGVSKINEIL